MEPTLFSYILIPFVFRSHLMIPLPNLPKVVQKKENKALFEIEPLYPGYGVTIGNSLRRILLSSLEGAAITEVKIKGAEHEFVSLEAVLEDVIYILLNLKKIRLNAFTEEPQVITLQVKGEKEVRAKDFKPNPQVKIANPEAYIATLTDKKAELEIEAKIEKGIGYEIAEERERGKAEVGVIPIDAIFTPVKQVSFNIENIRVGKRTDFERLALEIETDGTVSPEKAFEEACDILMEHFCVFLGIDKDVLKKKEEKPRDEEKKKAKKEQKRERVKEKVNELGAKNEKVENLEISERSKNALLKNNIRTVAGILRKSAKDLLALEGIGEKGIEEIKKVLKKTGEELKS